MEFVYMESGTQDVMCVVVRSYAYTMCKSRNVEFVMVVRFANMVSADHDALNVGEARRAKTTGAIHGKNTNMKDIAMFAS